MENEKGTVKEKIIEQPVNLDEKKKESTEFVAPRPINISVKDNLRETSKGNENKENIELKSENQSAIIEKLNSINRNLDSLTKTVLAMEKRISLVEDQVKLLSH